MKTIRLKITGMHCEACIRLINMELKDLGVSRSEIVFRSGIATVEADERLNTEDVIAAITKAGYQASEVTDDRETPKGLFVSHGAVSHKALLLFGGLLVAGIAVVALSGNLIAGPSIGEKAASLFGGTVTANPDQSSSSVQSDGACPIDGDSPDCLMPTGAPLKSNKNTVQTAEAVTYDAENNLQTVRMTQTAFGFEPSEFTIKKGVPVKWLITSETSYSCAASIRMPKYDILKALEEGENVIEFTPDKSGTIPFSCGMGMVTGQFTVTD